MSDHSELRALAGHPSGTHTSVAKTSLRALLDALDAAEVRLGNAMDAHGLALTQREIAREERDTAERDCTNAIGSMRAQDERERQAGERCGVPTTEHGCDWPDAVADAVLGLRAETARVDVALKADAALFERLSLALATPERVAADTAAVGGYVSGLDLVETAEQVVGRAEVAIAALRARCAALEADVARLRADCEWLCATSDSATDALEADGAADAEECSDVRERVAEILASLAGTTPPPPDARDGELARLREALTKYGDHYTDCAVRNHGPSNRACDCGLDAALAVEPDCTGRAPAKVIYLAHPAGAATIEEHRANLARARRWFDWIARQPGVVPTADWILYCEVWSDFDPVLRAKGLDADDVIISRCDEVWLVGGRISSGMARGVVTANAHGVKVVDMTGLGDEPPAKEGT